MKKLDIFIKGETMNLCIPTYEFARDSKWYSWFNDPKIVRFLGQGMFPNTPEDQIEFFKLEKSKRLILIISNKSEYMGVISLSNINLIQKTCDIAMAVDSSIDVELSPYISLEAIAKLTEHAFNVMGINRIFAIQHVKLKRWQQRMELIGYRVEGLHKNGVIKGREINDSLPLACLYSDFENISNYRGSLWDSKKNMEERYKKLPKEMFVDTLRNLFEQEGRVYYEKMFLL